MANSSKKSVKRKSTNTKKDESNNFNNAKDLPSSNKRLILCIIFSLLFVFQIVSFFNSDGFVISFLSDLFKGLISWGVWLLAPVFLYCAILFGVKKDKLEGFRIFSALVLPILFSCIISLFKFPVNEVKSVKDFALLFETGKDFLSGGVISGFISCILKNAFSVYASFPILLVLFMFFTVKCLNVNFAQFFRNSKNYIHEYKNEEKIQSKTNNYKTERDLQKIKSDASAVTYDIPLESSNDHELKPFSQVEPPVKSPKKKVTVSQKNKAKKADVVNASEAEIIEIKEIKTPAKSETVSAQIKSDDSHPTINIIDRKEIVEEADIIEKEIVSDYTEQHTYKFPPVDLLKASSSIKNDSNEELLTNRARLESSLHSFGINAVIKGIIHGPTVTRYDIELDQGVKLSRVTNLAGDIALSLGVSNVRIAPIPEKISTVGIEVPNKIINTVSLREIIDSEVFRNSKSKLSFALGKNISGECVVGNISKLPHMLIAGTTGSGKSVCMNSLILSLLYKSSPEEVRLIMIDPKMVELGIYNGIPHLFVPVVTEPKKAAGALQWSVVEMLKRYRSFSEAGVRDLESYNSVCLRNNQDILPQIVVVIDELADLMMVASKEVEESICRVAQMGRAAGVHLIIATQRPSADVITGLMKANIPSRIAFAVSSAMESRIILDQSGAEKLIGMGDMLYSPVGSGKPMRIQGAYVSDEERENIVNFIKQESGAVSNSDELREYMEKASENSNSTEKVSADNSISSDYDEMLPKAVDVVLEMKSCSVSMLQRRIKLGYSRAARIVDQMEELGIVGPYEGSKPRGVLVDSERWNEMKISLGFAESSDNTVSFVQEENSD